jgi:hypothetical protein
MLLPEKILTLNHVESPFMFVPLAEVRAYQVNSHDMLLFLEHIATVVSVRRQLAHYNTDPKTLSTQTIAAGGRILMRLLCFHYKQNEFYNLIFRLRIIFPNLSTSNAVESRHKAKW